MQRAKPSIKTSGHSNKIGVLKSDEFDKSAFLRLKMRFPLMMRTFTPVGANRVKTALTRL